VEILGDGGDDGPITGVRVVRNRLVPDARGGLRAEPTGEQEVISCGLVVRSIGYRGRPLPGVPFDERRGLIRNDGGRVIDPDGAPRRGEYVVGWIKRGPSGVIGTNKKDAADTAARIAEDAAAQRLNVPGADASAQAVQDWLRGRAPQLVTWAGWGAIDRHERDRGDAKGRPRVKIVRVADMLALTRECANR
jgi:ferredoxin--NADP+ reductase